MTHSVQIVQTHRATVVQSDTYQLSDTDFAELSTNLYGNVGDEETFVLERGIATDSLTEIDEIQQTISVDVLW